MENLAAQRGLDLRQINVGHKLNGKSARKIYSRFMPCNPLISHDSDEGIQGNPRESNAPNRGFQSETAKGQENPNGSIPSTARPYVHALEHWCKEGRMEPPPRSVEFARLAARVYFAAKAAIRSRAPVAPAVTARA